MSSLSRVKKARKRRLKNMRLSPGEVEDIARQFVRKNAGRDLTLLGVSPSEISAGVWWVSFEAPKPGIDPNVWIVCVSDQTGLPSFL